MLTVIEVHVDRLPRELDSSAEFDGFVEGAAFRGDPALATIADRSSLRLSTPPELFNLAELDVLYDQDAEAIWTFMRPAMRPSFTPAMLADFDSWQANTNFGSCLNGQNLC